MLIKWFGHSCFLCAGSGVRLLTDPFNTEVGYELPGVEVDLVTVSHDHFDHNCTASLPGDPRVIDRPGVHRVDGLELTGHKVYHDQVRGAQRGENLIFCWNMEGLRLCHLGDLGHLLEPQTVQELGRVDILMIPVGGVYTIDAREAFQVVEQLQPRVILPMHYQTPDLKFRLGALEEFTSQFPQTLRLPDLKLENGQLPDVRQVVVLDYRS